MAELECKCGPDGIDSKCVHWGGGIGIPVPDPRCDCYACDEARGGAHVEHVSAFEKARRARPST
jgi:hypothetical protein